MQPMSDLDLMGTGDGDDSRSQPEAHPGLFMWREMRPRNGHFEIYRSDLAAT